MDEDRHLIVDGPAFIIRIKGVQCDAAGCGYRDDEAPHEGEAWGDYVNLPCPWCGAALLTADDMAAMIGAVGAMAQRNAWAKLYGIGGGGNRKPVKGLMDGSGEIKWERDE